MANEIYDKTVFKRFFEVNDPKVLAWAENVLAKICGPGILPVYLNKEGEDFKTFWGTITHLFALIVLYSRQYNEIDTNKILFELFIENRGLVTNEVVTTEQMQYLFDNYIKEYEKRGRLDIISKEGVILGELLRLIQYKNLDEFIFALLMARDTGWTLGYSSPTWDRTDTVLNITKGYEKTISVEDLSKYPLINPTGVTTIPDQDNDGNPIRVMTFVGTGITGISSGEDKSKLMVISENLFYQLSFKLKVSSVENQNLKFGVEVFDDLQRPLICKESFGDGESNNFVLEGATTPTYSYDFSKDYIEAFPNLENPNMDAIAAQEPQNMFLWHQQDGKAYGLDAGGGSTPVITGDFSFTSHSMSVTGYSIKMDGADFPLTTIDQPNLVTNAMIYCMAKTSFQIDGVFQIDTDFTDVYAAIQIGSPESNGFSFMSLVTDNSPFYIKGEGKILTVMLFAKKEGVAWPQNISFSNVANSNASFPLNMKTFYSPMQSSEFINQLINFSNNTQNIHIFQEQFFGVNITKINSGDQENLLLMRGITNSNSSFPLAEQGDHAEALNTSFSIIIEGDPLPTGVYLRKFWTVQNPESDFTANYGEKKVVKTGIPVTEILYDESHEIPSNYLYLEAWELVNETGADLTGDWSITVVENANITSTPVVQSDGTIQLLNAGVYYDCTGILSRKNRSYFKPVELNFLNGRGLKMQEGMKYLSLSLTQDKSEPSADVYIYDIKIKPLFLPFTQGYLGEKNVIASYYENNSSSSKTIVNQFIETYLISYKNILRAEEIVSYTQTLVHFKVFSDRRVYLDAVSISIAGQTLVTDINGEALISLYPGDYLYSATKSGFTSIENEVLSVLDKEEQIVYISLSGALYERKVIFSVRDEQNRAVSGATVTFNGKFQNTGPDGTILFMAYPGLYSYTVVKDKYYTVNKSVLVQDDMVENVTLQLIPVSNLTFIAKNGTTPVSGVQITLVTQRTVEETSSNAVKQVLKITDENGQAVFEGVVNGEYSYSAEKVDWLPILDNLVVAGDQTINLAMNPVPTYTVKFVVNDYNPFTGSKTLLQGATVTYAGLTKITDANGGASFVVKGNSYSYSVSMSNHITQTGTYRPVADATLTIDLPQTQYATTIKVSGANSAALRGAKVTISGVTQETDSKGETIFQLPNGNYTVSVIYADYHEATKTFSVNGSATTVLVPMDQVLYNVTFTVKEEGQVSVGATVKFGSEGKTTSNQGIAVFQVPKGSYQWEVSKNIYVTQTGNVDVISSAITREINLIRKNGEITFVVKNDSGSPVEAATVICGDQTRTTNSNGRVTFTLPIGSYTYDCSKLPDYTSQSGNVSVTESPQTVNVLLSNKTYSVTFTVKVYWGGYSYNQVYNCPVTFNGSTKYTNSSGQVTFTNVKNGYYNYSAAGGSTSYDPKTGSVTMSNSDMNVNVDLTWKTVTSTITVYKDSSRASYVNVSGSVQYKNGYGSNYATISGTTNGSGQITFNCPAEGQFSITASGDSFVSKSISGSAGSSYTIYTWAAWILSFSSAASSVVGRHSWISSNDYETSGTTLKIQPSSSATSSSIGNLYTGTFENETSLSSVTQWPISWGFGTCSYMFSGCTNLSSVANGSPRISGSIAYYFQNCARLRSVPSGFFANSGNSGSSAQGVFYGSGLSSISGNLFSSSFSNYENAFRNCTSLTSATGNVFGTGASNMGGVFMGCTSLTSIASSVFYNCDYATTLSYAFSDCTRLSSVPSDLIQYCTRVTNFTGMFMNSGLQSIPSSFFNRVTAACTFQAAFMNCKSLSSVGSNSFPTTAINFLSTFEGCSSLQSVANMNRIYSKVTDASRMFYGAGLTSLPGDFFHHWTQVTTLESACANCTSLVTVNAESTTYALYDGCINLKNVSVMFYNCYKLIGNSVGVVALTKENNNTMADTVTNYSSMFYGCSALASVMVKGYSAGSWDYRFIWLVVDVQKPGATKSGCFRGCTLMLNLLDVPASWR